MSRRHLADKRTEYFANMLKALASAVRLNIVRLLIEYGDHGSCVSDIQKEIGGAGSTLSHHLETLERFGLVSSRKEAQRIFYSVNYSVLKELFNFLWQDCCSRSPELVQLEKMDSRVQ
jgi:ArsR family transcriptional regulator, arsenate/arsenite/antimonite-responsive transcriptional repressor